MPAKSSIGGTAVQLSTSETPVNYGILIKAAPGNTGTVYVGTSNAVTANSNDTTDGIPLAAGEGVVLPKVRLPDGVLSDVWVIGSASGQKAFYDIDTHSVTGGAPGVTSGGAVISGGDVAHDAVDSGNPVKIGGYAKTTTPSTVADGDRVNAWFSPEGRLKVQIAGVNGVEPILSNGAGDNYTVNNTGLLTSNYALLYNPGSDQWDRERTNYEATAFTSAARTASSNSADLINYTNRGIQVVIDVTATSATPSVVFTVKGKCSLSGKYVTLLASAAITAIGTTLLTIYPGVTAAANVAAAMVVPRVFRIEAVHGDADSITYSVSVNLIR